MNDIVFVSRDLGNTLLNQMVTDNPDLLLCEMFDHDMSYILNTVYKEISGSTYCLWLPEKWNIEFKIVLLTDKELNYKALSHPGCLL